MSDPSGPLAGVTILDLASVGPAARASRWLADMGAHVIKVGPVPRQGGVQIVPVFYAYGGHRGMSRISFDLKADDGREAFLKLAESADVIIESFRPGVVTKLGVDYAAVSARNPGAVYCSTSGFGQTGPRSQWAGHDINYLAAAGFLDCTEPGLDSKPPIPGATVADSAGGGMHAAMSIMAALVERGRTGEGQYLDVSVADGVLALMSLYADEHLATGAEPGPGHNLLTGSHACYDTYRCADGRHVAVGAIEPHFYANLCKLLGCEQWLAHQNDMEVQDQIRADFAAAFMAKPMQTWADELGPADCCVTGVATVAEACADEQFAARGAIVEAHHPTQGSFRQIGPVLAGSAPVPEGGYVLPDVTESQAVELLEAAGMESADIARAIEAGVIA